MGTAAGIGIGIAIGIALTLSFVVIGGKNLGIPILEDIPVLENKDNYAELSSLSEQELRAMEVSWDYKDILRNPQKYEGKIIHFTAEVWKVQQKFGDNYWLEVQTDETCQPVAWDCGNFVVDYTGSRILKNDIVEVYAQVDDVDNYTILGSVIPVPYVTAVRLGCVSC